MRYRNNTGHILQMERAVEISPAPANKPTTLRRGWLKNGNTPGDFHNCARCGAKTRKGDPCRSPAMQNGRCRMHGGASTGPRTEEGREKCRRTHWKHGRYSQGSLRRSRFCIYAVQANILHTGIIAYRLFQAGLARGELDLADAPRELLQLDVKKHWRRLVRILGRMDTLDILQTSAQRRKWQPIQRAIKAATAMLSDMETIEDEPAASEKSFERSNEGQMESIPSHAPRGAELRKRHEF
jgi:hypothetical protein